MSAPRVIAHRRGAALTLELRVHLDPGVHLAAVPAVVHRAPVVREVVRALEAVVAVQMERKQPVLGGEVAAARVVLREHAQRVLLVVVEAAPTWIGAEIMIVGAVLHHQEHEVLDVLKARACGRDRDRLLDQARPRWPGLPRRHRLAHGHAGTEQTGSAQDLPPGQVLFLACFAEFVRECHGLMVSQSCWRLVTVM